MSACPLSRAPYKIYERSWVYVVTVLTDSFSLHIFLPPRNFSSHVVFGWVDIKGPLTPDDHPWISCFSGVEFIWSAQVVRAHSSTQTTCCIYKWSQKTVPVRLESCSAHWDVCHTHTITGPVLLWLCACDPPLDFTDAEGWSDRSQQRSVSREV